jgi:hypothetical protein
MEGIAVHFKTSDQGPSLRSVEYRNGPNVEFRVATVVRGDFTIKENFRPAESANAWSFKDVPFKVSSQAVLRLEVKSNARCDANTMEAVIARRYDVFLHRTVVDGTPSLRCEQDHRIEGLLSAGRGQPLLAKVRTAGERAHGPGLGSPLQPRF